MKRLGLLAGLFLSAAAMAETGPFGGENILVNGSFETDSKGLNRNGGKVGYGDSATTKAWTIGGNAGLSKPGSWMSPDWMHFPDGSFCAFIQGQADGSYLSQTFTAPQSGLYRLSFYHAARPGTTLGERVRVFVDDVEYGYVTDWSIDFDFSTFDIPIAKGQHTLKFWGDQNGLASDMSAVIDKVSLEIPDEAGVVPTQIEDYAFRFDFSTGAKSVSGKKYTDGSTAMTFEAVDGPNGSSTAMKYKSGWGSISDGDKSLNGDWSVALSCVPKSGSKQVIACVGGNGTVDRKQLLVCSETNGRMYFAIGQRWGSGERKNVPNSLTASGLVEPDALFHSVCCVHRKETNIICCYIDGMLVGRLDASYSCAGRPFMTGFQFNEPNGGAVVGINAGANVPLEDCRFFERALSDAEVALYAKTYPARRPSQSPVATDVKPTADTTYDSDPTADGTLFVPDGVTVTAPSVAGNYFNYGKIVLTGDTTVSAAPRGPGVMRFAGTQKLGYTGLGNAPVEIAGDVTINQCSPLVYRSSPLTVESGTVTLGGKVSIGDVADADYYDQLGATVNFNGGTLAGSGFFYMGGRKTQNDINVMAGRFTARVAPYGAANSTGSNRRVNVGGTGVFAPSSLAYQGGSEPGANLRTLINLRDGGTFEPPATWPAYVWLDAQSGSSTLALTAASVAANVTVEGAAALAVDAGGEARTLDLAAATHSLAGSVSVKNGATLRLPVGEAIGGKLTVAAGTKLVLDFATYAGDPIALTAAGGVVLAGDVEDLVEFVNASAGYYPALGEDGTTIRVATEDLKTPVLADWIGGGAAGKYDDPANWTCYNAVGSVVSGAIPCAQTTARVGGDTNFQLPYDSAAMLAAMDSCTNDNRMTTICAYIRYATRAGLSDYGYMNIPYADYKPLGEVSVTALRDTGWNDLHLKQSQLRFDGWFRVTEEQAGTWTLSQKFDDYYAMFFDGTCVLKNKTFQTSESATCTVTAGWHRFTLIVGDTCGGYGISKSVGGEPTVLGVKINGGAEVAFESAFELGSGPSRMWKVLQVGNCRLTADCDWSGLDFSRYMDGLEIDVNGHALAVSFGGTGLTSGKVTSGVQGGSFHVDVPANANLANTGLELAGKLQFVKEGAGTFTANRKNQSYTGGTVVAAGTCDVLSGGQDTDTYAEKGYFYGASGSSVTIQSGGTLDIKGNYDWQHHPITLAGGTLASTTVDQTKSTWGCLNGVTLTADSVLKVDATFFQSGTFDLNGHTLNVRLAEGKYWKPKASTFADNGGKVVITGPDGASTTTGMIWTYGDIASPTVDWDFDCYLEIKSNMTVRDFTCRREGVWGWSSYLKKTSVRGTFTPVSDYFPNVEMQDGSTIDLSAREGAWSTASLDKAADSTAAGYGESFLATFAENAAVTVEIGTRKIAHDTKIVSWTAKPANVTFKLPEGIEGKLEAKTDGLYFRKFGFMILIR